RQRVVDLGPPALVQGASPFEQPARCRHCAGLFPLCPLLRGIRRQQRPQLPHLGLRLEVGCDELKMIWPDTRQPVDCRRLVGSLSITASKRGAFWPTLSMAL